MLSSACSELIASSRSFFRLVIKARGVLKPPKLPRALDSPLLKSMPKVQSLAATQCNFLITLADTVVCRTLVILRVAV